MHENKQTKKFFDKLEKQLNNQTIKYAVQKQMFCPYSKQILDYRTAILIEQHKDDKLVGTRVISPKFENRVPEIKEAFEKLGYRIEVITYQK